jgi:hypothetical protein
MYVAAGFPSNRNQLFAKCFLSLTRFTARKDHHFRFLSRHQNINIQHRCMPVPEGRGNIAPLPASPRIASGNNHGEWRRPRESSAWPGRRIRRFLTSGTIQLIVSYPTRSEGSSIDQLCVEGDGGTEQMGFLLKGHRPLR